MTDLSIRANLSEPYNDWFEEVKAIRNFESNTETIRFLVKTGWEVINSDTGRFVTIPANLVENISQYIDRPDIQAKYRIYSLDDFVKKANERLLKEIEAEFDRNILYFEVRKHLNDEELEIAMAFEKCLEKRLRRGVSAEDIASELNRRDPSKIEEILDRFVKQNLLEKIQKFDTKLYHATL